MSYDHSIEFILIGLVFEYFFMSYELVHVQAVDREVNFGLDLGHRTPVEVKPLELDYEQIWQFLNVMFHCVFCHILAFSADDLVIFAQEFFSCVPFNAVFEFNGFF